MQNVDNLLNEKGGVLKKAPARFSDLLLPPELKYRRGPDDVFRASIALVGPVTGILCISAVCARPQRNVKRVITYVPVILICENYPTTKAARL